MTLDVTLDATRKDGSRLASNAGPLNLKMLHAEAPEVYTFSNFRLDA